MATKRITVMVCDNPMCGKERLFPVAGPPDGVFVNTGVWITPQYGNLKLPKVYACSLGCLPSAVEFMSQVQRKQNRERKPKVHAPVVDNSGFEGDD